MVDLAFDAPDAPDASEDILVDLASDGPHASGAPHAPEDSSPADESLISIDNDFLTDMFGDPTEQNTSEESETADMITLN